MPTGNTQQVINYGATANDGQGDPLRTAFIKTDDNFDNIWLAGPAGSNVRITNNTIGVLDTNGNLILSPNGIGIVQTNNHIVPRLNKTYDLGSLNLQYRTVYANTISVATLNYQEFTVTELTVNTIKSDDSSFVTIQDGLDVVGDIEAHGNVTADYVIGDGSQLTGISVGNNGAVQVNWQGSLSNQGGTPDDTYSTLQFDSNGMPTLDGTTAYQQRVDYSPYLQVLAPEVESTDFDIIAGPGITVVGYDDNYNIPRSAYMSVQDQANATQQWDFGILGNGSNNYSISDRTNSNTWTFGITGDLSAPGNVSADNVLTSAEVIASGVVQSGTGLSTGGYLSVNGTTDLHDTTVTGNLSVSVIRNNDSTIVLIEDGVEVDGNVTADYFIGDGSQLTNLPGGTGNVTFDDQAVVGTGDAFGAGGLYLAPGNASVGNLQYIRVRGGDVATHIHLDTGNNSYFDQYFGDDGKYVKLSNTGNIVISSDDSAGNTAQWTFDVNGGLTFPYNYYIGPGEGSLGITSPYAVAIIADQGTTDQLWLFGTDGNLTVPGSILGTGNLKLSPDYINASSYLDIFLSSGPDIHIVASQSANLILGKDNQSNVMTSWDGNVYIQSWDTGTGTQGGVWTFGGDGTTTFPTANIDLHNGGVQSGEVLQFGNPNLQSIITGPTPSANVNAQRLIVQGQRGNGTGEGGDVYVWAGDADINGGDIKIYAGDADNASAGGGGYINLAGGDGFVYGGDITLNGGYSANGYGGQISINGGQGQTDGGPAYINGGYGSAGNGGAVQITGGGSSNGQASYGNVEIGSGTYAWLFNNSGNLTLPNGAIIKDTVTAAVAFGDGAGANTQGAYSVAVGAGAGANTQGAYSVAVGAGAGANTQGDSSIAVGNDAGNISQGIQAVAIGYSAGSNSQSDNSVAIGYSAGFDTQGDSSVAIGYSAGNATQGNSAVAIGQYAGQTTQGIRAVAIGKEAGQTSQGFISIAIGGGAGGNTQGNASIAIGADAGHGTQGANAIAIGFKAGDSTQGTESIAIGKQAGYTNQANNSIILNATGSALEQTTANTFTVAPVRNDTSNIAEVMFYNATSKEVTYGNTISVAGNISGAYILGNGSGLTSLPVPTVSQDITSNGAMSIMTYDGNLKYVSYATVEPSTGNIAGNNISANGNISGGNISATGNITGGNLNTGAQVVATGNITGGNLNTGAQVVATGNITGGNLNTGAQVVATGNITGGNITTAGQVTATGNVSVGNLNVTGNIFDTGALSIITAASGNINLAPNGTTVLTVTTTGIVGNVLAATTATAANNVGYLGMPQNATGTATLTIADAGRHIYVTSNSQTITIPANSSVAYPIGTAIAFIAGPSATTVSIAITTDTMYLAGTGTTGTRTLAAYGMATAVKVASTTWFINGAGLT